MMCSVRKNFTKMSKKGGLHNFKSCASSIGIEPSSLPPIEEMYSRHYEGIYIIIIPEIILWLTCLEQLSLEWILTSASIIHIRHKDSSSHRFADWILVVKKKILFTLKSTEKFKLYLWPSWIKFKTIQSYLN